MAVGGPAYKAARKWLMGFFELEACPQCNKHVGECPHKPEVKFGVRPDVVGVYEGVRAYGEVDCRGDYGPCFVKIINAETGEVLRREGWK